jgi:membrane protein
LERLRVIAGDLCRTVGRTAGSLFHTITTTAIQVWKDFSHDDGSQAAAAFSFYSFLSLLALITLCGAVLGIVLSGNPDLLDQIMQYITDNVPGISGTIKQALDASVKLRGVLGLGGILGLIYMGTKVFDSFQIWLNFIWGTERPKYLKKKMKSLLTLVFVGTVFALGFGLHFTLFTLFQHTSFLHIPLSIIVFFVTSLVLFVGLAFIYAYSVEIKLGFHVVWKGALVSALFINPIGMLLSWYYTKIGNLNAVYGSFAGVVLTIIVIYYIGYIIYLGAELNRFLDAERPRLRESHVDDPRP